MYSASDTGRYEQSDPIGLNGGLNTYGCVEGNPLNFVDDHGSARDRVIGSTLDKIGPIDQSGSTAPIGAPVSEPVQAPRTAGEQVANRILGALIKKATGGVELDPKTANLFPVARTILGSVGLGVSLWGGGEGLSCDRFDCTDERENLPYVSKGNSCGAK